MASAQKLRSILDDVRRFCEANADKKQAKRYERFFTEGYDAYGIDKDLWLEKKDFFLEKYRADLTLEDALKLGRMFLKSGKYEEASFAYHLAQEYKGQLTRQNFQNLGGWLEKGIRNWAHTDILSQDVVGWLLENKRISLDDLASWRESSSKWQRRAVPVAMIRLLKPGKGVEKLLAFINPMMLDEDRFVHQGLGWFLREAWKIHPKPVESFLKKWRNSAPRKIFQYATEKMPKEYRVKFRRERKR